MLQIIKHKDGIQLKLSSELTIVNNAVEEIKQFVSQYTKQNIQSINLVLRELLNNAIEHGNKRNKSLVVTCLVEYLGHSRFRITVEDEGEGFDLMRLDLRVSHDPSQIRNRGLSLINSYVDQIESNPKGNRITVYLGIQEDVIFRVMDDGPCKIIQPTGNLTGNIAERFRSIIQSSANTSTSHFRFDLSYVNDMDSIILSLFVIFSNMVRDNHQNSILEIVNANQDIVSLFQMTRLDRIYQISINQ